MQLYSLMMAGKNHLFRLIILLMYIFEYVCLHFKVFNIFQLLGVNNGPTFLIGHINNVMNSNVQELGQQFF